MRRIISLFLVMCLAFCASACTTATSENSEEQEVVKQNYKIGDEVIIDNDGQYKLIITDVTETSERNEFSDKNPERVVVITYSYENISQDTDLYISDMNFKAYDKDNNAMETYPVDFDFPSSVSAGRKASGKMAFGLNSQENYIELEYYDNMFLSSDCKIVLEW